MITWEDYLTLYWQYIEYKRIWMGAWPCPLWSLWEEKNMVWPWHKWAYGSNSMLDELQGKMRNTKSARQYATWSFSLIFCKAIDDMQSCSTRLSKKMITLHHSMMHDVMTWVVKFCLRRTSALPALARFQVHCLVFWQINPCQAAVHEQRLDCATLMCPRNHKVNLLLTSWGIHWSLHLTCSHGFPA